MIVAMENKQDFLTAFAKLLDDEDFVGSSKYDLYNEIYTLVRTEFLDALSNSSYPRAPHVMKTVNGLLDYMENVVSLDYIIDKRKTYLQYERTNDGFQAVQDLFNVDVMPEQIRYLYNTYPIVILPAEKFEIEALNFSNIRKKISMDEYKLLLNFSNQDSFNLRLVLKVFIFYLPSKNKSACALIDEPGGTLKKMLNGKVRNESFAVLRLFENEWNAIYLDLSKQIRSVGEHIGAITNDIVRQETGTERLKDVRSSLQNRKKQLEFELSRLQRVYADLYPKLERFDSLYGGTESYTSQDVRMFLNSFCMAFENAAFDICLNLLPLLKKGGYEHVQTLNAFLENRVSKYAMAKFVERVSSDSSIDLTIARLLIFGCDFEQGTPAVIKKSVDVLKSNSKLDYSGKEFYALGLYETDAKKKLNYFKKGFYAGYEIAAEKFWEECDSTDIKTVKKLAFDLVPGACVAYGEYLQKHTNEQLNLNSRCLRFYKFASAQNYIPGIEHIAEFLFQVYFASYVGKAKEGEFRYKAAEMLEQICGYLIHCGTKPRHYQEYRGIALFCLSRFDEAMEALGGCQSLAAHYCKGRMWQYGDGTFKDLDQALEEYGKAKGFADAAKKISEIQIMKAKKAQKRYRSENTEDYDENRSYRSTTSRQSSGSSCFVTTAVCESLKKGDQCEELQLMRSLRDTFVSSSVEGEMLVLEYYRVGPKIVRKIEEGVDSKTVYENLWSDYLKRCCELQKQNHLKEALDLYIEMVRNLCIRYHVELNSTIVSKFDKKIVN